MDLLKIVCNKWILWKLFNNCCSSFQQYWKAKLVANVINSGIYQNMLNLHSSYQEWSHEQGGICGGKSGDFTITGSCLSHTSLKLTISTGPLIHPSRSSLVFTTNTNLPMNALMLRHGMACVMALTIFKGQKQVLVFSLPLKSLESGTGVLLWLCDLSLMIVLAVIWTSWSKIWE